jgi:hypothetical protein
MHLNFHRWKFFPLKHSILPNSLLLEFAMINTYQQIFVNQSISL